MLYIKKNSLNNVVVTVSQNKTLANPNYLFSFEHILSKEKVRFYPKDISTSKSRYDEFSFYEGEEPAGYTGDTPYVIFPFDGQYYYGVYEMVTTASTNPSYAFDKLEEGRAVIEDINNPYDYPFTYTAGNEDNENFVYYGDDYNLNYIVLKLKSVRTNVLASRPSEWLDFYPPLSVTNNYTNGNTEKYDYISGATNICGNPTEFSTDVFYVQVKTGSTGSFTMQVTTGDTLTYGYSGLGENQVYATYSNFTYVSGSTYSYIVELKSPAGYHFTFPPIEIDITQVEDNTFSTGNLWPLEQIPLCAPTPTPTPTQTQTPQPTTTPTKTPTPTVTGTPGVTPTQTPTNTPTPSITPSYTPTSTPTPTPTPNFYKILTESGGPLGAENGDDLVTEDAP